MNIHVCYEPSNTLYMWVEISLPVLAPPTLIKLLPFDHLYGPWSDDSPLKREKDPTMFHPNPPNAWKCLWTEPHPQNTITTPSAHPSFFFCLFFSFLFLFPTTNKNQINKAMAKIKPGDSKGEPPTLILTWTWYFLLAVWPRSSGFSRMTSCGAQFKAKVRKKEIQHTASKRKKRNVRKPGSGEQLRRRAGGDGTGGRRRGGREKGQNPVAPRSWEKGDKWGVEQCLSMLIQWDRAETRAYSTRRG